MISEQFDRIADIKQLGTDTEPLLPKSLTTDHAESTKNLPWERSNDKVLYGYRRQLYTYTACFSSAFTC
jgi:hypothetical protein